MLIDGVSIILYLVLLVDGVAIVLFLVFSITKYSAIFVEVKGYFEKNYNQLGYNVQIRQMCRSNSTRFNNNQLECATNGWI
jgi:hypothetical protein